MMSGAQLLLLAALLPEILGAQIIGGRVVDSATKRVLVDVKVTAVNLDSNLAIIDRPTDSTGVFYLTLGIPGRYRLRFDLVPTTLIVRDTFVLAVNDVLEREFFLAIPADPVFSESQVSKPAGIRPGASMPRYPDAMRNVGTTGRLQMSYIIDKRGIIEPKSVEVLFSSNPLFTSSVMQVLRRWRFNPAELRGKPVRQYVEQLVVFCLSEVLPTGPPGECVSGGPHNTIIITAFGVARELEYRRRP